MIKENSIGVFDSGVGGLTVLKELIKLLGNEDYIYFGDSLHAPYGERSSSDIKNLSFKIADFLVSKGCKMLVIACNTIVASAYEDMKKRYSVPVIDVVSNGAKAALKVTKNNNIAVMATPFTVSTNVYSKAIKNINIDASVTQIPCKTLCAMIESVWGSCSEHYEILKKYVSEIPKDVDTLILGCTHYPIVINDIKNSFDKNIVDPAYETAILSKNVLEYSNLANSKNTKGDITFYTSGNTELFKSLGENILGFSLENVEHIEL